MRILMIGAGAIATEYVKALKVLGYDQIGVLSRQLASAEKFKAEHNLSAAYGGGETSLPGVLSQYDAFIVGSPIETLEPYAAALAHGGARRVLLEKPSFLYSAALEGFLQRYPHFDPAVALNRFYYPSVMALKEQVQSETITSAEFSFTEWVHRINPDQYASIVMQRWGLSNCIHVIATAFDLIGLPSSLHASQHQKEAVSWHPHGAAFAGSGISARGVPFTYLSDWTSAGRWHITVRTTRGAYQLCPMEGLDFTPKGSVQKETLLPAYSGATKCGFEPMLDAWLNGGKVVKLAELLPHMRVIEQIFGYDAAP